MIVQPFLTYKVIEVIYRECNLKKQGWMTENFLQDQLAINSINEIRQCMYWLAETGWLTYDIYHAQTFSLSLVSKIDDNIIVSI
jgi:hypothetical protein